MWFKVGFMVLIGGVIGWMTNIIAIKLLFRPLKPVRIMGIEFVGLIPKRRNDIAKTIGETVDKELVSMDEITGKLLSEENKAWMLEKIIREIKTFVAERFSMIMMFLPEGKIDEMAREELPRYIDLFAEELSCKASDEINIGEIVEKRINEFPLEKIEEIIISIAKTELKSIERLGGVLGGIIGLIQGVIIVIFW